jgi:uncharacterized cupin superfamily protein
MPKIDIDRVPVREGSDYPAPFCDKAKGRTKKALGDAGGLTKFGVNMTRLPPGEWSSQRHWHPQEDEFVYVISGELTLVSDAGEEKLQAGDCAAFPMNVPNGHHLINKSGMDAVYLEVGTRSHGDDCHYPDVDLHFDGKRDRYTHKDGTPYQNS